jgi:serine/threonine protein kinase/DNA-binding transcriptional regulator YhcF (GntR family)
METDVQRSLLERAVGAQYEILRLLGQGAMGSVYLAREHLLERLVAVKVLRGELVHGDARERFIREARTAARLTHPFIVPLYSFGQADDTLFYIMGFVDGESLEERLRRPPRATPEEVRRLLIELADALDYAHGVGVIHRDIKPDNVLIDRATGKAVLTDFGIAKVQAGGTQITRTGIIVGTPLYMSPEQAAGDAQVDGRSDLYSLGVIGYRMLTGHHPYEGDSIQEVFIKQVSQPPEPIDLADGDVPDELALAIMRCLEREPSLRWPSAAAFRDALVAEGHTYTERSRLAPPRRWVGWWPSALRQRGDMWSRLPSELRRARTFDASLHYAVPAVFLPLVALGALRAAVGGGPGLLIGALVVGGALAVALAGGIRTARTSLKALLLRHRIPEQAVGQLVSEPTSGSKFWRQKEIALLLSSQAPDTKSTIDAEDEDEYCDTTLVHSGMFDHIDPRSPTPLYAQIATRLRVAIAAGELERGEALPSVRALAARLRINPATVVQAYRDLEMEGLVSTRHGAGTFVEEVGADRKTKDRAAEARRLVRDLMAQAGSLGITTTELRTAVDVEMKR